MGEIAMLADSVACFEPGAECRVIHRNGDDSVVVEFENPRGLLKIREDQILWENCDA